VALQPPLPPPSPLFLAPRDASARAEWKVPLPATGRQKSEVTDIAATSTDAVTDATSPELGEVVGGSTSVPACAANLAKNIIGAGVLSLPSGAAHIVGEAQAAGVGSSLTLTMVAILLGIFATLNAAGFYLAGEVCERTGARTYRQAWSLTMGEKTAWLPSAASVILCFTGSVACSSVIGDTASELVAALLGVANSAVFRDAILGGLAFTVLLPLCNLSSLAPLAFASVLGLVGICLLAVVMLVRCLNGSYLVGGQFGSVVQANHPVLTLSASEAHVHSSGIAGLVGQSLLFMALLSNAYSAHYKAPSMFQELESPKKCTSGGKLKQFAYAATWAFFLAGILYLVVTLAGLETFGCAVQPMVLNNYAPIDHLVVFARAGLCLCVLFEFPLLERCFRTTLVELFGLPEEVATQPWIVTSSVALVSMLACVPGLSLDRVIAIGGALGASLLIYVAPALMALRLREQNASSQPSTTGAGWMMFDPADVQAALLRSVAGFGTMIGGLGVAEATGLQF